MKQYSVVQTDKNITRQVLADHPQMMVVAFRFDTKGAEGSVHNHPHLQSTYVKSGRFRFTVENKTTDVGPGDSFIVPSNVLHGCVCLEPGTLLECFTPRRDEFL
jgi:quercetin dioxygenase-like cupin family protein